MWLTHLRVYNRRVFYASNFNFKCQLSMSFDVCQLAWRCDALFWLIIADFPRIFHYLLQKITVYYLNQTQDLRTIGDENW